MKISGVIAVIIIGLFARVLCIYALPNMGVSLPVDIDNLSAIVQYVVMFGLGVVVVKGAGGSTKNVFGHIIQVKHLVLGGGAAVLLVMLTLGTNALEVWVISQTKLEFAYTFWNFHSATYYISVGITSYMTLIIAQFVLAPIVEEFIFRGLLLGAFLRYGCTVSMLIVALIFTVLHYESHYWITTFIFSIVLSIMYLKHNSLWINIFAHAGYNISSFIVQYYFDFHWTRPISHLTDLKYWSIELIMFMVSVPVLGIFMMKSWPTNRIKESNRLLRSSHDSRWS